VLFLKNRVILRSESLPFVSYNCVKLLNTTIKTCFS